MWRYEEELRQLQLKQRPLGRASGARPMVFYGSSSIRFWDPSPFTDFTGPFLAEALGLDPDQTVNLGFGGATLEGCVQCFERIVAPFAARALVVYAGDNDLSAGAEPAEVVKSYRYLLYKTRRHLGAIPFTFLAIKPSPLHAGNLPRVAQVNARIRDIAAGETGCYFVDLHHPMLDPRGRPDRRFFSRDGVHLSAAGYALWAEELLASEQRFPIFGERVVDGPDRR